MLITNAQLISGEPIAVRTEGEVIRQVGRHLDAESGDEVVDAHGGTLIPGLHDHHIHLRAAVAAEQSVSVGPPQVGDRDELMRVLRRARPRADGWIRAVGYHDSVAGDLDRDRLDDLVPAVPLRIQHRSGAMWFLNSAGLALLGRPDHPTGRLFREDAAIAGSTHIGNIDFGPISKRLTGYGVTGVTEATPDLVAADVDTFGAAMRNGVLRQQVLVLSPESGLPTASLGFGPVKRILDDDTLDLDALEQWIEGIHGAGGAVAMHCVTVVQLVVAVTALRSVGATAGDRIEHAAMVPDEMISDLVDLGITVVTQPNFVAERGDQYLQDIAERELPMLWRLRSLHHAGVAVAGGTDAPFGDLDPWACMRAARDRLSPAGVEMSPFERIPARMALDLFLGEPLSPARPRSVTAGSRADLCLLAAPPDVVLAELTADLVDGTMIAGRFYPGGG